MSQNSRIKEAALHEYLDECAELLERIDKNMAQIEKGGDSQDSLAAIYRDMHTIKGSSHLFGFNQVGELAHAFESSLDPVRKGLIKVNAGLVDALFAGCDIIAQLLAGIRRDQQEPDCSASISSLIPRLVELTEAALAGAKPLMPDKLPGDEVGEKAASPVPQQPVTRDPEVPAITIPKVTPSPSPTSSPGFGFFEDDAEPAVKAVAPKASADPIEAPRANPEPKASAAAKAPTPREPASPKPSAVPTQASNEAAAKTSDEHNTETIRVHVALLDSLMNLVAEQVLIKNQLLQHSKVNEDDAELARLSQRLNVLTAELQNQVMKTRLQPVGNVIHKFGRVVRDMGRELGKKVELSIQGAETELDKTIIEAIKDPLTHIVRNSIDHGIESPAERKAADKPEVGRLAIKAQHESGQVVIEIADDGRGLDPKRIGAKAVEKGLLSADALAALSVREVQALIFAPGFSTAETVSNISGRGVGMDVVKTNIERIGGLVDLHSDVGRGMTIKFKIPLTLAIVPALIVRALGQRFAIPQSKLVELVLIDEADPSGDRIEMLQGSAVLRLRQRILPLLSLSEILSRKESASGKSGQAASVKLVTALQPTNIVILNADGLEFGLIVESVEDTADVVVKALAPFLKDLSHFSGSTIMGDGSVALAIDVMGLSAAMRAGRDAQAAGGHFGRDHQSQKGYEPDVAEFLLVDVGAPTNYAIPLAVVARLEEFPSEDFSFSGAQKVIRYRDALLPIFSLPEFLQLPFAESEQQPEKSPVVVIRRGENLYGIAVRQIRDVVSLPSRIDQNLRDRPGILGTMIAGDKVLVVVDILGMIDAMKVQLHADADENAMEDGQTEGAATSPARRKHRILLVEDSSFFRNYIQQVLVDAGYRTETAMDGSEGLQILESRPAEHFSLVLSDIEMPKMDGLELASRVSADGRWKTIPLVAITTRFSNADIERGRQAGFARYLEKLNAERLIQELDELLQKNIGKDSGKELRRASGE